MELSEEKSYLTGRNFSTGLAGLRAVIIVLPFHVSSFLRGQKNAETGQPTNGCPGQTHKKKMALLKTATLII